MQKWNRSLGTSKKEQGIITLKRPFVLVDVKKPGKIQKMKFQTRRNNNETESK